LVFSETVSSIMEFNVCHDKFIPSFLTCSMWIDDWSECMWAFGEDSNFS